MGNGRHGALIHGPPDAERVVVTHHHLTWPDAAAAPGAPDTPDMLDTLGPPDLADRLPQAGPPVRPARAAGPGTCR